MREVQWWKQATTAMALWLTEPVVLKRVHAIDSTRAVPKQLVEERCSEFRVQKFMRKVGTMQCFTALVGPKSGFLRRSTAEDFYGATHKSMRVSSSQPIGLQLTESLSDADSKPHHRYLSRCSANNKADLDCTRERHQESRSVEL